MIKIKTSKLTIIVNVNQIKTMYYDKEEESVDVIYTNNTELKLDNVIKVTINGVDI